MLPSVGSGGVPLYSVNVSKAKLRLLRIGDRNIIEAIQKDCSCAPIDNYDADNIAQDTGEEVWKGTLDVQPERNKRVTTLVPVTEMVPHLQPGVYVLLAERSDEGEDEYGVKATQWLIVTDLGLTTMEGADGLNVFLRSLDSGKPLDRVTLKLYARNNDELGSADTDVHGRATFAPGLMRGTTANAQPPSWPSARRRFRLPRSDPARLRSLAIAASAGGSPRAAPMSSSIPIAVSIARARPCIWAPCCATRRAPPETACR